MSDRRPTEREEMSEEPTPTLIDLVQELRRELGLFDGAMPVSPKQAWEEAIEVVRGLRRGWCHACEDRHKWEDGERKLDD